MLFKRALFVAISLSVMLLASLQAGGRAEAFPGADSVTIASQSCLPGGTVRVNVSWVGYNQGPQWLDLSLFNNGFAPNTFIGQAALPNQYSFVWDGLVAGFPHYLRVNTLTSRGWVPSATASFVARGDCGPVSPTLAAANVQIGSQTCTADGHVTINVSWTPSNQILQWVDLSITNNNFTPGTFAGNGPLSGAQPTLAWSGILPGYQHYLRVNTLSNFGWYASQTVSFYNRPDCQSSYSTAAVSIAGNTAAGSNATLNNVGIVAHPGEGYDRIVFQFKDSLPDVQISYQTGASSCGSGLPVSLPGTAVLAVRFSPAVAHDDMGNVTVNSIDVSGTGQAILEAKQTCDFEGVVSWALGTPGLRPFHAATLNGPNRLVIDVLR